MLNREQEIAWAAGLFEGEGTITYTKRLRKRDGKYTITPVIKVRMTDEDIVIRLKEAMGCGHFHGPYQDKRAAHYKPTWSWEAWGKDFEKAIDLLLPFLGGRRIMQYESILALVEENGPLNRDVCKRGHSEWGVFGGLKQCVPCRKAATQRWVVRRSQNAKDR